MKNIEKYQNLISKGEVDALLLTSKHNRQYAAEYCIAEGVAVICKTQSYYFTDFRYIESAQKNLPGFAVKMVDTEHPYTKLINEAISDNTVKQEIQERLHPMAVDMESAAVGHCCYLNEMPFVSIRCISDNADDEGAMSFDQFEKIAAKRVADLVLAIAAVL